MARKVQQQKNPNKNNDNIVYTDAHRQNSVLVCIESYEFEKQNEFGTMLSNDTKVIALKNKDCDRVALTRETVDEG